MSVLLTQRDVACHYQVLIPRLSGFDGISTVSDWQNPR